MTGLESAVLKAWEAVFWGDGGRLDVLAGGRSVDVDDWQAVPELVADQVHAAGLLAPGSPLWVDGYGEVAGWEHEDSDEPGRVEQWAAGLLADLDAWVCLGAGVVAGGSWSCWAVYPIQSTGVLVVTDAAGAVSGVLAGTN